MKNVSLKEVDLYQLVMMGILSLNFEFGNIFGFDLFYFNGLFDLVGSLQARGLLSYLATFFCYVYEFGYLFNHLISHLS